MRTCTHVHTYAHTHMYTYICTCTHVHIHVHAHKPVDNVSIYIPPGAVRNLMSPNSPVRGVFTAMSSPTFYSFVENKTSDFKVASTILGAFIDGVNGSLDANITITLRLGNPVEYHALVVVYSCMEVGEWLEGNIMVINMVK